MHERMCLPFQVFIGDIQEEKGQQTVDDLKKKFGKNRAFFAKCDITSEPDIKGELLAAISCRNN